MEIGPLEYVVVGVSGDRLHEALRAELNALRNDRSIKVVDIVVVTKDADGTMNLREIGDLDADVRASYGNLTGDLLGLLSVADVTKLAEGIPAGSSAIVVLFEHTWALALTGAVREAGGVAYGGGLVAHNVLTQILNELDLELDEQEETQDA